MMTTKADMHIHSDYSDGDWSISEIYRKAGEGKQMEAIALADHESINGYIEMKKKAVEEDKLWIIPGVELHTAYKNREVHLLGYFFEYNSEFLDWLAGKRKERSEISYYTVEKIAKKHDLSWEEVLAETKHEDVAVTKAHIIQALKHKKMKMTNEEKRNYFHPDGDNYIPFLGNKINDAVGFIESMGGIPVLAHPGLIGNDEIVRELLVRFPQMGMEVYYHYFFEKEKLIGHYRKMAESFGVDTLTGGSDFHGSLTGAEIGNTILPEKIFQSIERNK